MPKRRIIVGVGWSSFYFGSEIRLFIYLYIFNTFTSVFGFEPTELSEFFTWQDHHLNLGSMASVNASEAYLMTMCVLSVFDCFMKCWCGTMLLDGVKWWFLCQVRTKFALKMKSNKNWLISKYFSQFWWRSSQTKNFGFGWLTCRKLAESNWLHS